MSAIFAAHRILGFDQSEVVLDDLLSIVRVELDHRRDITPPPDEVADRHRQYAS
jgi:hypothetical protein